MTGDLRPEKYTRLIQLKRRIAREETWQAIDEHIDNCEHKQKPAEEADLQ
jgi:hypothetical protein